MPLDARVTLDENAPDQEIKHVEQTDAAFVYKPLSLEILPASERRG